MLPYISLVYSFTSEITTNVCYRIVSKNDCRLALLTTVSDRGGEGNYGSL